MQSLDRVIIRLNNLWVRLRRKKANHKELMLLFPACLQSSKCEQKITNDLGECKRCGNCKVKDILELQDKYNIQCAVATGGMLALEIAKKENIGAIVAVACEKELKEGILRVLPKPGIGIFNRRPHGPCKDTDVELEKVKKAIEWFLR